ncbi:MAG TPA: molybdenum cofactor guanylyltransferase [Solirubrobacteraceae bacterium]|nr:molybdenum cofactor guanylyltransferase [Solirubrobacteraceae bacterium]
MDQVSVGARRRPATVAVLAGGRATRMGVAKASVDLCGQPLIAYPLRAAHDAGLQVLVVAKRSSVLPPLCDRVVFEPERPSHPLCGIVAALRHTGAPVLAVGCDMPFLNGRVLDWLARADGPPTSAGARATVAEVNGRVQPLPALYRPADLPAFERALACGGSLQGTLEALGARVIAEQSLRAFGEPRRLCFSVNDPCDLQTARRWMAG